MNQSNTTITQQANSPPNGSSLQSTFTPAADFPSSALNRAAIENFSSSSAMTNAGGRSLNSNLREAQPSPLATSLARKPSFVAR